MKRRPTAPDGTKVERRKETRFPVSISLEVSWKTPDGVLMKEEAVARLVNARGGLLDIASNPELGTRVTLTNVLSAETIEARVLATPNSRIGVSHGIVVELVSADEGFWGASLQVKIASAELQSLEKSLRSQNLDPRLLKEFRDAVDYLQAIAGSVQQTREPQTEGNEESTDSRLVGERIRRAINFTEETKGLTELVETAEQISQRFRTLLTPGISRGMRDTDVAAPEPSPVGRRSRAESRME